MIHEKLPVKVGDTIKSFNRHTFGVVKRARVVRLSKTHVTLEFGTNLRERYLRTKSEWFIGPNGDFVTL